MQERIIKAAFNKWRADNVKQDSLHPDEETLACFIDHKLSGLEFESIKSHLLFCESCAEIVSVQLKLKIDENQELPEGLIQSARELLGVDDKSLLFEIILRLKDKAMEIISTSGDVLVGQELVPASILRSRSAKDFKDELTILKDFQDIRVEAKIENKAGKAFNVVVVVRDKQTQRVIKDLRVTLIRDDLELESYLTETGAVTFEHVLLGRYMIEISNIENKLASIFLDIKV